MSEHAHFRQRLDAVLRTRDASQVQTFLIDQDQWSEDVPADPELAMWMMIAGSSTLRDLHSQAQEWLTSHGHEAEARALLGRGQGASGGKKSSSRRGARETPSTNQRAGEAKRHRPKQ